MIITDDNCLACGACVSSCPMGCIRLVEGRSGFYVPVIDNDVCISCGRCRDVCPANSRREGAFWKEGTYYALWANDAEKRKSGSSGGVFGMIAEKTIAKGGLVFGAAYAEDYMFVYQTNTDDVELDRLKKSKYVESYTGDIFVKVKSALSTGRQVLYCGTSCQIDGLLNYLGQDYENLLTCDFLCHGVPAIGVYRKYIADLQKRYGAVRKVDFRSKAYGWKAYCAKVEFASGYVYLRTKLLDPYLRIFFENVALRDACFSCRRLQHSNADITLGDWWHVTEATDVLDTDEGISLVGVHSDRGMQMIRELISDNICYSKELRLEQYSYAYQRYSKLPKNRDDKLQSILKAENLFSVRVPLKTYIRGICYQLRAILRSMMNHAR